MTDTIASVQYQQLLYFRGHGHPFWVPEPNASLSAEYIRDGTRYGDVGLFTDNGGFDYLFNVHHPADHAINTNPITGRTNTPPDFVMLEDPHDTYVVRPYFRPKATVTSKYVKEHTFEAEASVESP